MPSYFSENKTHILFIISVVAKGLNGLFELAGAIVLFISGELTKLVIFLTRHELGEDPTDFVANQLRDFLPYLSFSTQFFVAWYFLIHGITNIVLVTGLLKKKLWVYPIAMIVQSCFVFYQLYRFIHTHSVSLILLSIFDIFLIWLISREYKRIKIPEMTTLSI